MVYNSIKVRFVGVGVAIFQHHWPVRQQFTSEVYSIKFPVCYSVWTLLRSAIGIPFLFPLYFVTACPVIYICGEKIIGWLVLGRAKATNSVRFLTLVWACIVVLWEAHRWLMRGEEAAWCRITNSPIPFPLLSLSAYSIAVSLHAFFLLSLARAPLKPNPGHPLLHSSPPRE